MFRPCIDLHQGRVKQIVGDSLGDGQTESLRTHFVSDKSSRWFAELYRRDNLRGGHVIKLGPGNDDAAREALRAFPGGLQLGGGVNAENASTWLDDGASHAIVTSWMFRDGVMDWDRLVQLKRAIGRNRLVLDLSCRKRGEDYFVVADRWKTYTRLKVDPETLGMLAKNCSEFLVHGVDVEGLRQGIDETLLQILTKHSPIPTTYAGGATSLDDLKWVTRIGAGRVHLTIGSALDIFGGTGVRYDEAVHFNRSLQTASE